MEPVRERSSQRAGQPARLLPACLTSTTLIRRASCSSCSRFGSTWDVSSDCSSTTPLSQSVSQSHQQQHFDPLCEEEEEEPSSSIGDKRAPCLPACALPTCSRCMRLS